MATIKVCDCCGRELKVKQGESEIEYLYDIYVPEYVKPLAVDKENIGDYMKPKESTIRENCISDFPDPSDIGFSCKKFELCFQCYTECWIDLVMRFNRIDKEMMKGRRL